VMYSVCIYWITNSSSYSWLSRL